VGKLTVLPDHPTHVVSLERRIRIYSQQRREAVRDLPEPIWSCADGTDDGRGACFARRDGTYGDGRI